MNLTAVGREVEHAELKEGCCTPGERKLYLELESADI